MSDERRGDKRAPIAGVKVTYEDASGTRIEEDVLDLAVGGIFIRSLVPMSVGKRIALDLTIVGEPGPWSALGRVVWTRPDATPGRPAGMGVKIIDMDDATAALIARLVETREVTAPGVGQVPAVTSAPVVTLGAPERERTLMGVGLTAEAPPPPTTTTQEEASIELRLAEQVELAVEGKPAVPTKVEVATEADAKVVVELEAKPSVEPLAPPAAVVREQSVAIDLVTPKKDAAPEAEPARNLATPPPSVPPARPGGGARWVVVVLLLIIAGIAAYVLFDGFLRPLGR
jgi:uncharacterized protein (TIGR02266 family)